MKKIAALLLVIFLGCAGGYVLYDRQQSIAQIAASLDEVRAALKEAQDEDGQYTGGLVKALIGVRIQILKTTIAMLEQKQRSFFHRIDLAYTVEGAPLQPVSQAQLDKIQADISEVDLKISEANLENEKYIGGLVKGLIEMRIQTEKQTRATLAQQYIFAKYGMAHILTPGQQAEAEPKKDRPTVPDKGAL